MKTSEIRSKFLAYFESKGHTPVKSSSLVPAGDNTLLFTNAGMNQFKDVFLGNEKRPYTRACSSQKCVRAGGKHNDLENVGYTARHHTFFEMLGNFSFGDYFKRDALKFAWEFLTSPQWLGIPKDKLLATVYAEDDEAFGIWVNEIGLPADRVVRIGDNKGARFASDNFWQMGDTGPCGPCSEIFYDHGSDVWGGRPGSAEEDGDRYTEIWNCVFMQYNRDESGEMHPLPKPSVDTGMGLERIAAVMQGVHSNYETDLFVDLIDAAARAVGVDPKDPAMRQNPSLKVIADHIRSCAFLIADGVLPSNLGRGYVLRRIIRRAVRHGYKLGQKEPFFHKLVDDLARLMGEAFPELREKGPRAKEVLLEEETSFAKTISFGMKLLDSEFEKMGADKVLSGETAFKLYDTYGFPFDLTADICRERDATVDESGFEAEMKKQRDRARASSHFKAQAQVEYDGPLTESLCHQTLSATGKILALFNDGNEPVASLGEGQSGVAALDRTPFYAESGGQVGDVGVLSAKGGSARVTDCKKIKPDVFGHFITVEAGEIKVGDAVEAQVDKDKRDATRRNHSVTHLLNAALRKVLGDHVSQQGSMVDPQRARFDFSHGKPLSVEEIERVENIVNEQILANVEITTQVMAKEEALKTGAIHLFNEKYGDRVRVVRMGDFSVEFCGGTHAARTGDIGMFALVSEGGIASGVRRVEGVTGMNAVRRAQAERALIRSAMHEMKANVAEDLPERIRELAQKAKRLDKDLSAAKTKLALSGAAQMLQEAETLGCGIKLALRKVDAEPSALRVLCQDLTGRDSKAAVLFAIVDASGKVSLGAAAGSEARGKIAAGDMLKFVAEKLGGKGGGKPDFAQGGAASSEGLDEALAALSAKLRKDLA